MIILPHGTEIPEKFIIAGQEIKVLLLDTVPGNNYGSFCDATNTIKVAKTVEVTENDKPYVVELNDGQIVNSFFHEVIHAFQFYYNNEFSEAQAQVYANFICEYLNSKK